MPVLGWWRNDKNRIIQREVNCYTPLHCWSYTTENSGGGGVYLDRLGASDREVHMQFELDYFNIFSMNEPIYPGDKRTNAWICGTSVWTSRYIPMTGGPTRDSEALRLPKLRFRTPPLSRMCVCCDRCVLSEISALGWSVVQGSPAKCVRVCVTKCQQVQLQASTPTVSM
jgi:hypothetical protein